jgi:uncharacterized membrane protein (DUF485 family)
VTWQESTMLFISEEKTREILSSLSFRDLVSARARLRWGLSLVAVAMFFGFIALTSSASHALGMSIAGSDIPLGICLAFAMIVGVVALTGFYVHRSNVYLDGIARVIRQGVG